jgi:hypothetical protein
MYCYSKGPAGDYGFRRVDFNYEAAANEYVTLEPATPDQLSLRFSDYLTSEATIEKADSNAKIIEQIQAIELKYARTLADIASGNGSASITDPINGGTTTPTALLAAYLAQVAALRAQLA